MTHSPTPENQPTPPPPRPRWARRLTQIGIPLGGVVLIGTIGGAWWGWVFIQEQLAPLIASNLSQSLKRPVKLGKVERFSFTSLRFGPSSLPATATDPDSATLDAIEVSFNPLRILLSRNLNLGIQAINPKLYLEQDKDGVWISTKLEEQKEEGPIKTDLESIQFKNAEVVLVPWGKGDRLAAPVRIEQANGNANFFDSNRRINYKVAGKSATGGTFDIMGETRTKPAPSKDQETNLQIQGQNFLVAEIDRLIKLPVNLEAGRGSGNISVKIGSATEVPLVKGTAKFENVTLTLPGVPFAFTKATGGLQLDDTLIRLDNVSTLLGKAPIVAKGDIDTKKGFNLTAKLNPVSLPNLIETLKLTVPVAIAGEVTADIKVTGGINQPILSGIARSTKPSRIDQVDVSRFSTRFQLETATSKLTINEIQATPAVGGQVIGSGQITDLTTKPNLNLNFQVAGVPGDAIAKPYNGGNALSITVGRVSAQAQVTGRADNPQTFIRWQAPEATYSGSGELLVTNVGMVLRNTVLNVAGGTVKAEAQTGNGRWQAVVDASQVQLNRFSADLKGLFDGRFSLSGSLASFKPSDIRAQGNARLSQGISVIGQALTAQVQWDGQKVIVQRAESPGLLANGTIAVRLEGTPEVTALDLNVQVSDYSLQAFALPTAVPVQFSGRTDFTGRLTGSPTAPSIAGTLNLRQFILNGIAFEPVLRGNLNVSKGVILNLAGQQDRIAVALSSDYQPLSFEVQRGQAIAKGRAEGDLLRIETQNFPVSFLTPPEIALLVPVSGVLNSSLLVDLKRLSGGGQVAIADPQIANFKADSFRSRVSFDNGVATLTGAELKRGQSVFQVNGSASLLGDDPQVKGQLKIASGQLQDVLQLLQLFDIQDLSRGAKLPTYGTALDLQTTPIQLTDVRVLYQLRRISELKALLAQTEARRKAALPPELRDLKGSLNGEISVVGSLKSGVNADFDFRGQDWTWGRFSTQQVVAIGSFNKGVLTLRPFRMQSGDALVTFSGQVGGPQQSGQLRIESFPVEALAELLKQANNGFLPVNVEGKLNATATLAGSLDNPQAVGELTLDEGTINGTDIREAKGNFQYTNARLEFGSDIAIAGPEPITVVGSIPYPLPFAAVQPDNDNISLDIDVKNEGLALMNLVTNQVAWVDGQGKVNLKVRGTLQEPNATGTIEVANATLQARALPEPIKNVTGRILFEQDRLRVEKIQGTFSRGDLVVSGVLPIFAPLVQSDKDYGNPLNVNLNQLSLRLKGIYQGAVNGAVKLTGTALNPVIGGLIRLTDGEVQLSEAAEATPAEVGQPESSSNVSFSDLKIQLGDRIRVTRQPIINFLASGDLTIGGTLNDLRPSGTIRLNAGQVNLFTTQFNLEGGYPQTAEFEPNQGLDPILNVRLIASVPEVTSSRQPASISSSEILDTPASVNSFGGLQTVRVQARARGLASKLYDNLELSSSPARSSSEIVALIGGGFVATLGRGDSVLGIANLAGSALLTNIQGTIGNALGLSEFRLFPTLTRSDRAKDASTSSTLGLAAEGAINLSPSIAFSVLRLLTSSQPTQFGIRYRLNDRIILRGSTDLSGDNQAVVEFETRF